MMTERASVAAFTMLPPSWCLLALSIAQTGGEVVIPLDRWLQMEQQIAALEAESPPPVAYGVRRRTMAVTFVSGVLRGELELEVETLEGAGPTQVPLLDRDASLADLRIDGQRAVAVRTGSYYAALIDTPGVHRVVVSFVHGREQTRFARAFSLALPIVPVSHMVLQLPEREVDVEVEGGVVLEQSDTTSGSKITAAFDARDRLSVRWHRRATHDTARAKEMEVDAVALVRMEPELVVTESLLTFTLVAGETDRVEASIPDGVEVTRVTGDSILQWYTEEESGRRRLIVLLKHLVSDRTRILIHAQAPLTSGSDATVTLVSPMGAALRDTWIAVEGRAGFELTVKTMAGGEAVRPREVPAALSGLTEKPLLYAYRGQGRWPALGLVRSKNTEINLTQAVIDDLQASTVLVQQGLEVTKLRFYLRNNTRQYLSLRLPPNAQVTHAMIDGAPFLPAVTGSGDEERLLVPLRQSERITGGRRKHTVRGGDTLGGISLRYFGTTDRWNEILDANFDLHGPSDLIVGQQVDIPSRAGEVTFEESNFVVEIAYKVHTNALGRVGSHRSELPKLDIPVMSATWHYYFPSDYEPLRFGSNLEQLSAIRYDPLRRLRQFWERARFVDNAWASGGSYSNILEFRKTIYQREQRKQVTEALAAFPLVGQRYRFERVLLDREQAHVELVYASKRLLPFARLFAFLLALIAAFRFARGAQTDGVVKAVFSGRALTLAAAAAAVIVVGHYVLGVHRHALLGLDAGLALVILPPFLRRFGARIAEAVQTRTIRVESWWRPGAIFKIGAIAAGISILLAYPMLLSTACLVTLVVVAVVSKKESADA